MSLHDKIVQTLLNAPACVFNEREAGDIANEIIPYFEEGSSVLQPWVMALGWKMQSILLSGLRAPDVMSVTTKKICRWMRAISQHNADPTKGYMEPQAPMNLSLMQCMDELEYMPCHYVHHFADALRVVAIYHPVKEVRDFAGVVHCEVAVEIFHFRPETDDQFIKRHQDNRQAVASGSDVI